jgi:thiol-disulfide isomerase/thioredoxin
MKTETLTGHAADAPQGACPAPFRRQPPAAVGRGSYAWKTLRMLALAPVVFVWAAFAQTEPSPKNEPIAGVGMVLQTRGADFVVAELVPASPAAASTLIHKGDRVLGVAEGEGPSQLFVGKTLSESVAMIRGKAGTAVRVMVVSEGAENRDAREVLLTRERLNLEAGTPFEDDAAKPEAPAVDAVTPGLAFERLPGGEADKLSNYRGKFVALEFWATWCDPSQEAMAELQRTAAQSKILRGKVAFITVSMDRAKEMPAARVKEKGWADTLNGWAAREALGPWQIHGLPMTYLIDADGKIIAGNPRMTQQMLEDLVRLP